MTADSSVVTHVSTPARRTTHPHLPRAIRRAALLATLIAVLAWGALAVDGVRAISRELAAGHGLPQALFLWLHFFTILTSFLVATLMTVTAWRLFSRRMPPGAAWHAAGLVYILVVCATYEAVLRSKLEPRGIAFDTSLVFHDIVPALMLIFWIGFAPKRGLAGRFLLFLLIYPTIYFLGTLIAGALGEPYPYSFLDASKLGYRNTFIVGLLFWANYLALGMAIITASRRKRLAKSSDVYDAVREEPSTRPSTAH